MQVIKMKNPARMTTVAEVEAATRKLEAIRQEIVAKRDAAIRENYGFESGSTGNVETRVRALDSNEQTVNRLLERLLDRRAEINPNFRVKAAQKIAIIRKAEHIMPQMSKEDRLLEVRSKLLRQITGSTAPVVQEGHKSPQITSQHRTIKEMVRDYLIFSGEPLPIDTIKRSLNRSREDIERVVDELKKEKRVKILKRHGVKLVSFIPSKDKKDEHVWVKRNANKKTRRR